MGFEKWGCLLREAISGFEELAFLQNVKAENVGEMKTE